MRDHRHGRGGSAGAGTARPPGGQARPSPPGVDAEIQILAVLCMIVLLGCMIALYDCCLFLSIFLFFIECVCSLYLIVQFWFMGYNSCVMILQFLLV